MNRTQDEVDRAMMVMEMLAKNASEAAAAGAGATLGGANDGDRLLLQQRMKEREEFRHRYSDGGGGGAHDSYWVIFLSYMLLAWLFLAQWAIVYWKKTKPSQYFAASLLGLWTFPFVAAVYLQNWRFVICCLLFTLQAVYIVRMALRRPLDPDTPQFIYRFFLVMYRVTFSMGVLGGAGFFLIIFVLIPILDTPLPDLLTDAILLIVYGGYFGVMGRDFAQVISDHMSRAIGVAASPARRKNACALCGHDLQSVDSLEFGREAPSTGPGGEGSHASSSSSGKGGGARLSSAGDRKLWTLSCTHQFHEECIRGWAVVGKRSSCPSCGEKVDTNAILASSPWERTSTLWLEFLDLLRMSLVWNPLILVSIRLGFWIFTGS